MKISIALEALTGTFETDMQRASKRSAREMRKIRKQAAQMGRAVAAAVAVAGAAMIAATKSSVDFADGLAKSAKTVGVGVEALQELRFAAEQSGIGAQGLDDSLRRLQRRAGEFANSGAGPAQKAFEQLGISVVDASGKVKDTETLFEEIVVAMEDIEDTARRTALQAQLFGDDFGPKLDVLIRQGIKGVTDLRQEARDLGIVLSAELAAKAEDVADKMNIFNRVMRTQIASVVLDNAEAINSLVGSIINMIPPLVNGTARLLQFIGVLKEVPLSVREENLAILGQELRELDRDIMIAQDFGQPTAFLRRRKEKLVAELRAEEDAYKAARERAEKQLRIDVPDTGGGTDVSPPAIVTPDIPEIDTTVADAIAALELQAATLGMTEAEVQLYRLALDGASDAQLRYAETVLGTIDGQRELMDLQQQADAVVEANKNGAERFAEELGRLNDMLGAGVLAYEEYERAVARIQDQFFPIVDAADDSFSQMDEFAKQAASNMQDVFADLIFDPFQDGLSGMISGFADAMRRMLAEAAAAALLKQMFSGFAGSDNAFLSSLGAAFGGSRDSGGRGQPGKAYYIGTGAQPEMFIPDTAGTFVPASQHGSQAMTFQTIVQAPQGRITRESEGRARAMQMGQAAEYRRRNS